MKKKIYVSIILLFIILNIIVNNCYAVGTFSSQISTTSLNVNETGTITVTGTNSTGTYRVTSSNSSVVAVSEYDSWVENSSKQISFTAKSAGTAILSVSTVGLYDSDEDEKKIEYSKEYTITVKAPATPSENESNNNSNNSNNNNNNEETDLPTASDGGSATTVKSSNNYLKSLKISTGSINFNKKTTKYTINVTEETENITITATAEHEKATVKGTGNIALKKGNNTINVVVTAENGSARNYQLTVVRPGEEVEEEEEETIEEIIGALTSLKLKGVKDSGEIIEILLTPEFSKDVFYYECEIPAGINFIDVEHASDILDAIVEVTGNENLVDGENLINIIIKYTDENDEEQIITYQISAKKQAAAITQAIIEEEQGLSSMQIGVIAGGIVIILIIIIILVIKHRRQQNEMDFGGYGEPFYSEEDDEIFEEPIPELKIKEEQEEFEEEISEQQDVEEDEIIQQEDQIDEWEEFEPVKKKKIFGKSAKKGKHF